MTECQIEKWTKARQIRQWNRAYAFAMNRVPWHDNMAPNYYVDNSPIAGQVLEFREIYTQCDNENKNCTGWK